MLELARRPCQRWQLPRHRGFDLHAQTDAPWLGHPHAERSRRRRPPAVAFVAPLHRFTNRKPVHRVRGEGCGGLRIVTVQRGAVAAVRIRRGERHMTADTLYEKLGGWGAVVDIFYDRVLADPSP